MADTDDSRTTRLADGADDDLAIAAPEDFEVRRDDEGEILPVKQRIPGTDRAVLVKPMPPGAFQRWLPVLSGQDEDSAKQAEVLREWVVEPEAWATADEAYVEDALRGGVLGGLLKAIRNAAGYEVFRAAREEELADAGAMLEHMDEETLSGLLRDFGTSDGASAEH